MQYTKHWWYSNFHEDFHLSQKYYFKTTSGLLLRKYVSILSVSLTIGGITCFSTEQLV